MEQPEARVSGQKYVLPSCHWLYNGAGPAITPFCRKSGFQVPSNPASPAFLYDFTGSNLRGILDGAEGGAAAVYGSLTGFLTSVHQRE